MSAEDEPVPSPLTVRLRHEQVMAAALASRSRGHVASWWMPWLFFGLLMLAIWLGHLASFYLVQQLPFPAMFAFGPYLPVAIPAVFCLVASAIANHAEQTRISNAYLKHLARIGSPLERDGTYEITPDALVLTTERMVLAPRWNAIDTVEKGADGWVLSADQLHFLIPFEAFSDVEAQRPLLAAITARLTPEARARSREAVDFAEVLPEAAAPARSIPSPWSRPSSKPDAAQETLPGAPTAAGWLTQEQAGWAAGVIYSKVAHPGFHRRAYPLTAAIAYMMAAIVVLGTISFVVPFDLILANAPVAIVIGLLLPLVGGALGLAHGHKRLGIVLNKAWRAGLADRGVPEQVEAHWSLTATGLRYDTHRFSGEAPYVSIHQVLHESGYWLVATDALTLCIPQPAFASEENARAFIGALLSHLDHAARERSVTLDPTEPT